MGVFQNNLMGAAAAAASAGGGDFYGHQIANSVRMQMSAGSRLRRTPSSAGNRQTWAISMWVKRAKLGDEQFLYEAGASGNQDGRLRMVFTDGDAIMVGTGNANLATSSALFRDTSAFYHIHWKNTGGTNTVHVNGTQVISVSCSGDTAVNNTVAQGLGCRGGSGDDTSSSLEGYISEFLLFDGTAYSYTDVTDDKNGVLIPADPSGLTFGTNGTWLKFESSSDLGNDSSGNNNDWTASNIAAHDQMLDSPTFNSSSNGGNFCTYNPLNAGSYATLSEGNLKALGNTSSDIAMPSGTFAMTSGKWYFERLIANESSGYPYLGLAAIGNVAYNTNTGGDIWAMRFAPAAGTVAANGTAANVAGFGTITATSTGLATATTGDIIGFHLDLDNRKCWITKNGAFVNSGDPSTGTNPQWSWTETPNNPISFIDQVYNGTGSILNAGQDGTFAGEKTAQGNSDDTGYGNFYYAPDTGFLAMCSGNQPTADAVDPAQTDDDYPQKLFGAKTYTGTGSSNAISGLGFQPDWVWIKERGGANNNMLFDSNRGTSKYISSNTNGDEGTDSATMNTFGSDGFTVGSDGKVNNSSDTYVAWNWRANGGTTTSNSNGSLASVTQTDPSGCFSIGTYTANATNSTIGHGLSVAPNFLILKKRDNQNKNWIVWSTGLGNDTQGFINLNTTGATQTDSQIWQNTAPTSTVFSVNYGTTETNAPSGDKFVFYAFANCEGYIKSGSYVGNGNADGSFVNTGFRPALVVTKRISGSTGGYLVHDNARNTGNPANLIVQWNSDGGEFSGANDKVDMLSNGFKVRSSNGGINASGSDYLYIAMAHNPFKYATAR